MSTEANNWPNTNTPPNYHGAERRSSGAPSQADTANNTWRPLQLLNLYRLLISGGLCVLLATTNHHDLFNDINLLPLGIISLGYLVCSVFYASTISLRKPKFSQQVSIHIITDVIAITLLAHFSGDMGNDIAVLLAVSVAGGSVLSTGRTALFFAALASFAVLADTFYSHTVATSYAVSYTHAGILGVTFFATAILATYLAQRIRNSENLAEQRGSELLTMEQLTRYVIQRMQTGVLVLDDNNQPQLMNQSTQELLSIDKNTQNQCLDMHPTLKQELLHWQQDKQYQPNPIKIRQGARELMPRFAQLGRKQENAGTLIFLEDNTALAQQAQQLKLASLGRLTASIAHEIRNPLSAISHAGQLLAESAQIHKNDQRLTEIISQQSKRLDKIVGNVMQLSQRKAIHTESINLLAWLAQLKEEFCQSMGLDLDQNSVSITSDNTSYSTNFDPSHLHQVVWNLCANALQHGQQKQNKVKIAMCLSHDGKPYLPVLDIIDYGPGVDKQLIDKIFEPFFTTDHAGTGLGLYIARELCTNNQAHLNYLRLNDGRACFRINFADTRRHQTA